MKSQSNGRKVSGLLALVLSCGLSYGMQDLDDLAAQQSPPPAPSQQFGVPPFPVEQLDLPQAPGAQEVAPQVPGVQPEVPTPPVEQTIEQPDQEVQPAPSGPVPISAPEPEALLSPVERSSLPPVLGVQEFAAPEPELSQEISPAPIDQVIMEPGQEARLAPSGPLPMSAPEPGLIPSDPIADWQISPEEMKDADVTTINEERGNWFFKAKILKDARKVYEKIRKKIIVLEPLEDTYRAQRDKIDAELNIFYQEYGFQSGQADKRLKLLIEEIKKLEDQEGRLDTKEERDLLAELQQKKEEVEAAKKEFDELRELDAALNQAVATLVAQIKKANNYDEQSWEQYEKIELTLSDELAQELLNKIQNAFDNIVTIEKYLQGEFKAFFEKSTRAITEHTEKVKALVISLKEHGIGLGKKMSELLAKEEAAKQEEAARERARLEKELAEARKTWFAKLTDSFARAWSSVQNLFVSAYNSVAGWFAPQEKAADKAPVAPDTTPAVREGEEQSEIAEQDVVVQQQNGQQAFENSQSQPSR